MGYTRSAVGKKTAGKKNKGGFRMARFTIPRDLYYGKGSLETLKTL